jgi:F-type H+-transporting ATPase subunit alpha
MASLTTLLNHTLDTLIQTGAPYRTATAGNGHGHRHRRECSHGDGITPCQADELLMFRGQVPGIVLNLDRRSNWGDFAGPGEHLEVGQRVERTGRVMDVPVGDALLGRVIDATGQALDGQGAVLTQNVAPLSVRPRPSFSGRR